MSLSEGDRAAWRAALNVGFGSLKLHKSLVQDKLLAFHDGRGESMLDVPLDVDVTDEEGWYCADWPIFTQYAQYSPIFRSDGRLTIAASRAGYADWHK